MVQIGPTTTTTAAAAGAAACSSVLDSATEAAAERAERAKRLFTVKVLIGGAATASSDQRDGDKAAVASSADAPPPPLPACAGGDAPVPHDGGDGIEITVQMYRMPSPGAKAGAAKAGDRVGVWLRRRRGPLMAAGRLIDAIEDELALLAVRSKGAVTVEATSADARRIAALFVAGGDAVDADDGPDLPLRTEDSFL